MVDDSAGVARAQASTQELRRKNRRGRPTSSADQANRRATTRIGFPTQWSLIRIRSLSPSASPCQGALLDN